MNSSMTAKLIYDWVCRSFGTAVAVNLEERACRVLEEAAELAQASQVSHAKARIIIDSVFFKPTGAIYQEIGGVGITLLALCEARNIDLDKATFDELRRILHLDPMYLRAKQNIKAQQNTGIKCDD